MNRMLPISAVTAALALTFSATAALAQDASPDPLEASPATESPAIAAESPAIAAESPATEPGTQAEAPHPAHIHSGTCETLGDVVFPLSNVSTELLVDGEPGAGERPGGMTADPMNDVQVSVTTVQAALTDITGAEHAINVHLSDDEIQTYIACGTIAGSLILDSGLAIRLHEQSFSGHHGIAWLAQVDEGSTAVYIFLVQDGGAMIAEPATPDVSPAASPMVGEDPAGSPMAGEEETVEVTVEVTTPDDEDVEVEVTTPDDEDVEVTADESPAA